MSLLTLSQESAPQRQEQGMPSRFAFRRGNKRLLGQKVPGEVGAEQTKAKGTGTVWNPPGENHWAGSRSWDTQRV